MKLIPFFRFKRPVGWQGPSGAPNPVVIGTIVALLIGGVYALIIMFAHKG